MGFSVDISPNPVAIEPASRAPTPVISVCEAVCNGPVRVPPEIAPVVVMAFPVDIAPNPVAIEPAVRPVVATPVILD